MSGLAKNFLRPVFRAAICAALRLRAHPLVLAEGPLLVIAPHPDDEALGCGGLIAARRAAGGTVIVIFLTDGAASHREHPELSATTLAARRRTEALASLAVLGVSSADTFFLDAPDGELGRLPAAEHARLVEALAAHVRRVCPTTIVSVWRRDGSTEHEAAALTVNEALRRAEWSRGVLLEYPVWSLWNPRWLARSLRGARRVHRLALGPYADTKRAAVQAHRSQLAPLRPQSVPTLEPAFVAALTGPVEYFFEETA